MPRIEAQPRSLLGLSRALRRLAGSALGRNDADGGSWESCAREGYVRRARDLPEVERRDRAWDRESSNAYGLARWL